VKVTDWGELHAVNGSIAEASTGGSGDTVTVAGVVSTPHPSVSPSTIVIETLAPEPPAVIVTLAGLVVTVSAPALAARVRATAPPTRAARYTRRLLTARIPR
jgi:hypothetical protein